MKVMLWKIIYRGNLKSHTLSFTKAFCDQQGIDVIRVFYIYSSFYTTGVVATGAKCAGATMAMAHLKIDAAFIFKDLINSVYLRYLFN